MPRKSWSKKDERMYEHVKGSERQEGRGEKTAKEIAARTVNKQKAKEGRTKTSSASASKKRGESTSPKATTRKPHRAGSTRSRSTARPKSRSW